MRIKIDSLRASLVCISLMLPFYFVLGAEAECPEDPQGVCDYYFPGSVLTNYCYNETCFGMNYGTEVRVLAINERGHFSKTFFFWGQGELDSSIWDYPCLLEPQGKDKIRVEIPPDLHCGFDFIGSEGTVYREFFESNPWNDCLAWGECAEQE